MTLIKCPGCDMKLPEQEAWAQIMHMEMYHPEIITKRLEAAGFKSINKDGKRVWFDLLASSND